MIKKLLLMIAILGLGSCAKPKVSPTSTTNNSAPAAVCAYEVNCDCSAPGHTLRWEVNYCMGKIGTHVCESTFECVEKAKKKFKKELTGKTECEQNQFWQKQYCKDFHKKDKNCFKDIPEVVRSGC